MYIKASSFCKMLRNNADENVIGTPEGKLCLAVIEQALADSVDSQEARMFFRDGRMDIFADLIGLNPVFVREQLSKIRTWVKK